MARRAQQRAKRKGEEQAEAAEQHRRFRLRLEEHGCTGGRVTIAGILAASSDVAREQQAAARESSRRQREHEAAAEAANSSREARRRSASRACEIVEQPSGDGEG